MYGHKQPVANLSVVDFCYQLRKHTIAQVKYVTFNFLLVFSFTSAARKFLKPLSVRNTNFFVFLAVIIQENLDKQHWIENGQRFAIHLLTLHSWLVILNKCKKLS